MMLKWKVEFEIVGRRTVTVEAEDDVLALVVARAAAREQGVDLDWLRAETILPVPDAVDLVEDPMETITLHLADGRDVAVPLRDDDPRWRPILACDYPGRWWTDGYIAVALRRAPPKRHRFPSSVKSFSASAFRDCARVVQEVENRGAHARLAPQDGAADAVILRAHLPLVWAPESGLWPLLGPTSESPVLGVRKGRVVAVVMPVQQ